MTLPGDAPAEASRPIDAATLSIRAGVDPAAIDHLVELGILHRPGGGPFREQDITTVRLAFALESSGIPLEDVAAAAERGALPDFARVLMSRPVGLLGRTHGAAGADLGLSPEITARVLDALGLPDVELDSPIREDDAELLEVAATVLHAGLPEETLLLTLRIFAEHLDRIAEHQRGLFRRDIQDSMMREGVPRAQMLEESARTREHLVELSYRAAHLIHRRMLERHAFENTAEQMELLLDEAGVRRRPDHDPAAIAFVDLSGFTRMTQEEGDEHAAEQSTLFAQVVRSATGRNGGRVVKLLGDGAMVRFDDAAGAVSAAAAIVEGAARGGALPAARAGIAAGPLIRRDGDYFGHTVNLAARICDAAGSGTVLANEVVASLTPSRSWSRLGEVELRGVPGPVTLVQLDL